MADLTPDLIACWRANYGLDKRTPEEAMRWWSDNNIGQAPAGAVAALGLCLDEIARLTRERDEWRADAARLGWLIAHAYSGLDLELLEPHVVGLVIGDKVAWPDGVRAAIDAVLDHE